MARVACFLPRGNFESHFTKSCTIFHNSHFAGEEYTFWAIHRSYYDTFYSFRCVNDVSFLEKNIFIHVLDSYGCQL